MRHKENLVCPVCCGMCAWLDVMDLNKPCLEVTAKAFNLAGIPIYYALCSRCGFCFAPEMHAWTLEQFEEKIYNDDYVYFDPDCVEKRPRANAAVLRSLFQHFASPLSHLDYGGGNAALAQLLQQANWDSVSYDPFYDKTISIEQLGTFELITAFEVFEHVPDVQALMSNLMALRAPDGLVLFSTLLSDGNIFPKQRLNWWYASPRNGHISLFSKHSLAILARNHGLNFASFSSGFHVFFSTVPRWAAHLFNRS